MLHLDFLLSRSSANMQLAFLLGPPVVSVWGAAHPYAGFLGYNQKKENAVGLPLECRPCSIFGNKACIKGDYECLNNLSYKDIIARIYAILDEVI